MMEVRTTKQESTTSLNRLHKMTELWVLLCLLSIAAYDWKSSKLGASAITNHVEIGGGNIPVKQRGSYRFTVWLDTMTIQLKGISK